MRINLHVLEEIPQADRARKLTKSVKLVVGRSLSVSMNIPLHADKYEMYTLVDINYDNQD